MSTLNPPEEITMRNEARAIPDKETTTPVVKQKRKYIRKKLVIKKSAEEIRKLKQHARQLTRKNKNKLTSCPKCDRLGYANYFIRSGNHKLVLAYKHANEPPIGHTKFANNNFNIYRECWVGNILTESEFFNIPKEQQQQPVAIKHEIEQQLPVTLKQFEVKPLQVHDGDTQYHQHDKKTGRNRVEISFSVELMKIIDKKRGKNTRSSYLRNLLKERLND